VHSTSTQPSKLISFFWNAHWKNLCQSGKKRLWLQVSTNLCSKQRSNSCLLCWSIERELRFSFRIAQNIQVPGTWNAKWGGMWDVQSNNGHALTLYDCCSCGEPAITPTRRTIQTRVDGQSSTLTSRRLSPHPKHQHIFWTSHDDTLGLCFYVAES
jgi:hypothetical protein